MSLLIAGCGAGAREATDSASGASTPPPGTAPASPPATPTSTPPTSPPPTSPKEQALATVREYFDAANYAIQTGDTRRIRAVTDPGCPCFRLVQHIESDWAAGRRMPEARLKIVRADASSTDNVSAGVTVDFSTPEYAVLGPDGRVTAHVRAQSGRTIYTLVRYGGSWHLTQAVTVEVR